MRGLCGSLREELRSINRSGADLTMQFPLALRMRCNIDQGDVERDPAA
jgi:hypothetical protein